MEHQPREPDGGPRRRRVGQRLRRHDRRAARRVVRNDAIWVTCRVGVSADPGFAVSTYATSSIGCNAVYVVVEEIEHW
ncbi:MAG: hypothetical protein ABW328_21950 [Ilumatobacteraceae bacterium]